MIFSGVCVMMMMMMMMPTTNNESASIMSFTTAWSTTPPSTTPQGRSEGGGVPSSPMRSTKYNYLASMADDGLLRVGGRPVDVDEHGCGR
jgi:hypothetical protein